MAGRRNPEKEAFWRDVLDRQAASGLSIRKFCTKERVSEPSFFAWRRKLGAGHDGETQTSIRPPNGVVKQRRFIPLALVNSSTAMELLHPLGYRIRLTGEVDATALNNILDVLDGRSRR